MTWVHTHYTMFFDFMSSMTVTEKVSVASLVLLVSYVYGSSSSFTEEMFVHDYLYDYVSIIAKKKPLFPCAPREITNIPYLNTKVTNFPFHVFDRYEIHIQDVEEHFRGIFIFPRCPSSTFQLCKIPKCRNVKLSKLKTKWKIENLKLGN